MEPTMEAFIYGSEEFEAELREDAHAAGEVEFLRSLAKPGMNALDVGAHRGVTTVTLARSVGPSGHVYAFEPVPQFCQAARDNLKRNAVGNAEVFELALSDRRTRLRFYQRGGSSGVVAGEEERVLTVEATTVVDFLAQQSVDKIDLLSLDCEGSELRVLRGAEAILREQAPLIFCEVHPDFLKSLGQSPGELAAFLEGLGYRVKPVSVEALDTKPALEECSHIYARRSENRARIQDLEARIRDLKGRMPAHSLRPSMLRELEELEEELRKAKGNDS
jgi:FkbM family methyltransferase